MRALVPGLVILGLTVLLLTRDHASLSGAVPAARNIIPVTSTAAPPAGRSIPREGIQGDGRVEAAPTGIAGSVAASAGAARGSIRPIDPAVAPVPRLGQRSTGSSAARVRELAPGSSAHAEAIASMVDASETQASVAPVARLYFAYFNRAPDYEGLNYYIDEREHGTPLDSIAGEFAASLEFDLRYGPVDNAGFVDRVYENVVGRAGSPDERGYWIGQLDSGGMTRGEVMLAFSEGARFRGQTANAVFVTMAYAQTLGRAPDPAQLGRWVAFLDAGNPRTAMIGELLRSRRGR